MTWLDWIIVVIPLLVVLSIGPAFLAAGRIVGRYVICERIIIMTKKRFAVVGSGTRSSRYISAEYFAVVNGKHQPVMLTVRKKTDGKKEIRE